MTVHSKKSLVHTAALLLVSGALASPMTALAQDASELQQVKALTQSLIDVLVEGGVISRDKAERLMELAKSRAQATPPAQASAAAPAAAEVGADGKKVVRVTYVPEAVKQEIREKIKEEVLVQSRQERWGEPNAFPEWLNRFKFEGDFRLREELVALSSSNTAPGGSFVNGASTRAADFATTTASNGLFSANTNGNFDRTRIRARLGVTAQVNEEVSSTLRLSTGNTSSGLTSNNQTLSQNFNNDAIVLNQAFVTLRPWGDSVTLRGGRMPNPFFSTDLVWAEDMAFDGIAATLRRPWSNATSAYLTAGYFPLTANTPNSSVRRSLVGLQTGFDQTLSGADKLHLGAALYGFQGVQGSLEDPAAAGTNPLFASRYEYSSAWRQRGNTLFNVCPGSVTTKPCDVPVWGLASGFQELNLTASMDLNQLFPVPLRLTGDYVRNLAFDQNQMAQRLGTPLTDGKDYGWMVRAQIGNYTIANPGDWNASLAYRYLGSDAVMDAFPNSDFGMGGTNNKGTILGFNYGIWRNSWISARWMTSDQIDSYAPGSTVPTKLSVDTIQVDLNARF